MPQGPEKAFTGLILQLNSLGLIGIKIKELHPQSSTFFSLQIIELILGSCQHYRIYFQPDGT